MYQAIKLLCKEKNISVYQLEKTLGLSTGSVSKWGKSTPRADTLLKVSNYFGVSMESLLKSLDGGEKEESEQKH